MKNLFYPLFALAITAMTFVSCEDVPMPYNDPNNAGSSETTPSVQPLGTGTADDPFNIAAANDYVAEGGDANAIVYVKGIISSIKSIDVDSYGNAEYYISDDGTTANQFYVYRGYGLNGAKFKTEDDIKVGDEVVVSGKLVNYNGTYEFAQGSTIFAINGEGGSIGTTGDAKGTGTLDDPYNPAGVIAYIQTLGSDVESPNDVYIKGKVASITEQYGTQYGNATFTIVEEGAEGTPFTVYRALYLGNQKYTSGDLLKEGDEVIVCGKVVNFRGNTPETVTGKAYLYALNGKTADNGGQTTPTGTATGDGTLQNPYNSVAANQLASSLTSDAKTDNDVYIKGKVVSLASNGQFSAQYGNATFYISDDGTAANQFYVFRALYLGNQKYTSGEPLLKEGDEVVVCGKLTNYRGNTPETAQNEAYVYSINGQTTPQEGGTTTKSDAGTYDAPLTVPAAIAKATADEAWVTGYIVGYVNGQKLEEGATFAAGAVKTNLLVAATASETNVANCLTIQLPAGDIRNALNLADNPSLLGQQVLMKGVLAAYFNVPGLKPLQYAEVAGKSVGTK